MISRKNLNQFVASGKMCRKKTEQFESTDHERRNQESNRRAKKNKQQPEQISGLRFLGKKIISQRDQSGGNSNEGNESDEPIEDDCQERARFFVRRLLEQVITLNDVSAGAS